MPKGIPKRRTHPRASSLLVSGVVSTTPTDGAAPVRVRVRLTRPLSKQQMVVTALLSEGWSRKEIAAFLQISIRGVRFHVTEAARKVPGDLPPLHRLVVWWRGGDLAVLTGIHTWNPDGLPPAVRQAVSGDAKIATFATDDVGVSTPTPSTPSLAL